MNNIVLDSLAGPVLDEHPGLLNYVTDEPLDTSTLVGGRKG